MKIIAFLGSPRVGGNTETLLDKVIEGIESKKVEANVEVEKIVLNNLKITPCQHCNGCLKDGNCVIQDDMQMLYPKITSADRIIIASPIFFMGLSAQTKAMIDRCNSLWARKYVLKIPISNIKKVASQCHSEEQSDEESQIKNEGKSEILHFVQNDKVVKEGKIPLNPPFIKGERGGLVARKGFLISVGGINKPTIFEGALKTIKAFFVVIDAIYSGELLFCGIDEKGAVEKHPTALKDAFLFGEKIVK